MTVEDQRRLEMPPYVAADIPTTSAIPPAARHHRSHSACAQAVRSPRRPQPANASTVAPTRIRVGAADQLLFSCLLLMMVCMVPTASARAAMVSAKCYFFGPGTTISGADYRREHGLSRKACAESCKTDVCCMGFEWLEGRCTLKSRSLNGTIEKLPDAYFGLCLDFDEGDRDRFWDHELGGSTLQTIGDISRDDCAEKCGALENAIIYSWHSANEQDEQSKGECTCIDVLHSVKLSFGSAAGFLL